MARLKGLSFAFLLNMASGFGYSVLLSRLLGVEGRGIVYSYQMPALFLATMTFSLLSQPIFEDYKRLQKEAADLIFIFKCLILSAITASLFSIFYSTLSGVIINPLILCSITVAQGINLFAIELAKFNNSSKRYILSSAATPALLFIVSSVAFFVIPDFNEVTALTSIILSYIASFLLIIFLTKNQFSLDWQSRKRVDLTLIKRVGSMFIFRALGAITTYLDKLLIISFFSPRVVGLIAVCMSLESISSKLYTMLANYHMNQTAHDRESPKEKFNFYMLVCFLGVIGITFTYLLGEWFIKLIFGNDFKEASNFLTIIIATSVINGICWVISQKWMLAKSLNRIYIRQILGIFIFICGFGVSLFNDFGILGVLYSALFASIGKLIFTLSLFTDKGTKPASKIDKNRSNNE